jgi:hypothetical protein
MVGTCSLLVFGCTGCGTCQTSRQQSGNAVVQTKQIQNEDKEFRALAETPTPIPAKDNPVLDSIVDTAGWLLYSFGSLAQ